MSEESFLTGSITQRHLRNANATKLNAGARPKGGGGTNPKGIENPRTGDTNVGCLTKDDNCTGSLCKKGQNPAGKRPLDQRMPKTPPRTPGRSGSRGNR